MKITMKDQENIADKGEGKLYSQNEVNELLAKKENQTAAEQKSTDNRAVAGLVRKSNRILVSIRSHVFPFDFFPDTINVEEGRVTIISRRWLSSEVHSIDIKDISNIFINTSFIYSQLVIISKTFEANEIKLGSLRPNEAVYIRRIIEGLRVFENKQIDTSSYSKEKLISKLEELSTTEIVI